jgi:hypothetical protein
MVHCSRKNPRSNPFSNESNVPNGSAHLCKQGAVHITRRCSHQFDTLTKNHVCLHTGLQEGGGHNNGVYFLRKVHQQLLKESRDHTRK